MRLLAVLPSLALAPALIAAQPSTLSWGELAQLVRPDWTIRVTLPDGTTVEGMPARFEPDALSIRVVHTSDKSSHPKGEISIPRAQVRVVGIRKNRDKGRLIGAMVPVAAGIGVMGAGLAMGNGDCFLICTGKVVVGAGAFVAVAGGTAGYFIGRSVDRRSETVTVTGP
jgi:hypothetical protein